VLIVANGPVDAADDPSFDLSADAVETTNLAAGRCSGSGPISDY